ncbi:MAG TPA: helix-turn-helix domain-containing protein [Pyrinomonadaceae bacterium]|nr:helix-turn-helix domain-containing protein [Pyrinomonadaceae bacterium]
MTDEKKYTAKEAAQLLDANRATISAWCRDGKFPNAEKVKSPTGESYWLIPESDLKDVEIKMGRPKKKEK